MKAVIMAGGEGSRLRPLTCDRPKPMVPIMDRPIMEYIIDLLKKHGVDEIAVTLMYMPENIKEHFGDGRDCGVDLHYFVEETPLGTAGSVKNAGNFLDQTFLVISGDALTDFDLSQAISYHREKKAAVTVVLTRVPTPLEYGVVITDQEGRICRFLEKPSWGEVFSDTVNTGIYIIEPDVFKLVPPGSPFDFSKDLFPLLLEKGYPMYGCILPGYWCDIGNLSQYRQAHYDILSGFVQAKIDGREIRPGIWLAGGAEIHPEAHLERPLYIGANVKIDRGAHLGSFSVIGANSILDEEASIKKSILWRNVYLGKKASLRGATVCHRVKIKAQASVYEGAVVGDDSILDAAASIRPGVKIWPHKTVEKGIVLRESLIWGEGAVRSLFGTHGITGDISVEMTPQFAGRLGAAYGSCLKKGGPIGVGADGSGSAQMIKSALITGLLSVGCRVLDIGLSLGPVTRFAVRSLSLKGGIQITAMESGDRVRISFFNEQGVDIAKGEERKIESAFYREDFARVNGRRVSLPESLPDIMDRYARDLMQTPEKPFHEARLRLAVGFDRENFGSLLPALLEKLGFEVSILDDTDLKTAAEFVVAKGCDAGAVFSPDGENFSLIDSRGRLISDDYLSALVSQMILSQNTSCTLVAPVTAPDVIDTLASRYQGRVIRAKTARQSLLSLAMGEVVLGSQKKYPQFFLQYDALRTFLSIMEYLAGKKISLAEEMDGIPDFFTYRKETACPWTAKGTVMRRLIEEQPKGTDFVEGVRVSFANGGRVLVLPSSEEAVCQVFSEGPTMEIAKDLTAMTIAKVNHFQKQVGNQKPS